MTPFKPLGDRVVCRQHNAEDKTKGGLIIPDAYKEKPNLGEVLFVGPFVQEIKTGDTVILGGKWYTNFTHEGEELLIVNEPDVLGILNGPAE